MNTVEEKTEKKQTFEEAISELESIVSKLEQGDLDLEASISLFQKGIALTGDCGKILEDAEGKIVKLIKDAGGNTVEEPFNA
jgi:exodeoxyribonuclease VII small subunit